MPGRLEGPFQRSQKDDIDLSFIFPNVCMYVPNNQLTPHQKKSKSETAKTEKKFIVAFLVVVASLPDFTV